MSTTNGTNGFAPAIERSSGWRLLHTSVDWQANAVLSTIAKRFFGEEKGEQILENIATQVAQNSNNESNIPIALAEGLVQEIQRLTPSVETTPHSAANGLANGVAASRA